MQVCTGCLETKEDQAFPRRGKNDDRPRTRCSACCLAYQRTRPKPKLDPILRQARTQKWLDKNPGWSKAYQEAYYEDHKEEIAARSKIDRAPGGKYYSTVLAYVNRRRALKAAAEGSHTVEEWEALKKQYDYRCLRCGKQTKLTRDHIIPLSRGGSDYISNLQPLCLSCNSKKLASSTDYRPVAV